MGTSIFTSRQQTIISEPAKSGLVVPIKVRRGWAGGTMVYLGANRQQLGPSW